MTDRSQASLLAGAVLSPDRRFRYRLWRVLSGGARTVAFVMCNPSTADGETDDPTVRRCLGFARSWGFSRLEVVNLFALRATDPESLLAPTTGEPAWVALGADGVADLHIDQAVRDAEFVICAWGASAPVRHRQLRSRSVEVLERVPMGKRRCLGTTAAGYPRHPLFVAAGTAPQSFGGS